ncbi:MAG: hypothetical protein Pars2KO_12930 [Parasphingorhabdus sp.]
MKPNGGVDPSQLNLRQYNYVPINQMFENVPKSKRLCHAVTKDIILVRGCFHDKITDYPIGVYNAGCLFGNYASSFLGSASDREFSGYANAV